MTPKLHPWALKELLGGAGGATVPTRCLKTDLNPNLAPQMNLNSSKMDPTYFPKGATTQTSKKQRLKKGGSVAWRKPSDALGGLFGKQGEQGIFQCSTCFTTTTDGRVVCCQLINCGCKDHTKSARNPYDIHPIGPNRTELDPILT